MYLEYLKEGKKFVSEKDNEDISFIIKENGSHKEVSIIAKSNITLLKAKDEIPFKLNKEDVYFLNGYQSWTDTKEFHLKERLRNIKKSPHLIVKKFGMDKYGDSTFYKYSINRLHGYDVFYSKGKYESFIYNLNYKNAYLLIELIKNKKDKIYLTSMLEGITLKKDEEIKIFDYHFFSSVIEGLSSFYKDFPLLEKKEKIFGYTSWYNYYQNINEDIILRDLDALDSRFNVFQIDDGYETFVGDWLDVDKKKFPNGLEPIVKKIHEKGYKAGIWLAPFALERNSKTLKEHPEWIKKDKKGKPVFAGGNWSGFYALDFYNKDAMEYVRKVLVHYMDMGFDFFKLDFLYAIALPTYEGKSRAMIQNEAYAFLREILKDKLVLGCGANIISSLNNFDYLRVGPDVSLLFNDSWVMQLFHRERPSTKVTLQNTIFRSIFNEHLFYNDPDVFLLRDENISLSIEQRIALTKLNALFGSVLMTSDDIATYDESKKKILDEALDIFKNGKVLSYSTSGKIINIKYSLHEKEYVINYDTVHGVIH